MQKKSLTSRSLSFHIGMHPLTLILWAFQHFTSRRECCVYLRAFLLSTPTSTSLAPSSVAARADPPAPHRLHSLELESLLPSAPSPQWLQLPWCCRITESQHGRGWKGPLWVIQSNPPAEAGSPRTGCTGPPPGGSWISPEKETPQPPWAACSRAPSPSEGRSCSSWTWGSCSASVCAHCPLSCRCAPLKSVWPHPLATYPYGTTSLQSLTSPVTLLTLTLTIS